MTEPSPFKSKGGIGRLFNALTYSLRGVKAAYQQEAAFRQELMLAAPLVPAAFWLGRDVLEVLLLLGTLVFVLVVEMLNSALEAIADSVTLERHPMIGRAKDMGSAAVMMALIFSAIAWLSLLYVRLA
ncbi:MAG TPA: diacylglycerol kinase [Eoetvoesiella sp.]